MKWVIPRPLYGEQRLIIDCYSGSSLPQDHVFLLPSLLSVEQPMLWIAYGSPGVSSVYRGGGLESRSCGLRFKPPSTVARL